MKGYAAEVKEHAVQLAVASEPPLAQTACDPGINANMLHTWIGTDHRAERQTPKSHDEHLCDEVKRQRKDNTRLKEARDLFKKAAASVAQPRP